MDKIQFFYFRVFVDCGSLSDIYNNFFMLEGVEWGMRKSNVAIYMSSYETMIEKKYDWLL